MSPVYTGNRVPVIHHLDHLFCHAERLQILLHSQQPASAFLELCFYSCNRYNQFLTVTSDITPQLRIIDSQDALRLS